MCKFSFHIFVGVGGEIQVYSNVPPGREDGCADVMVTTDQGQCTCAMLRLKSTGELAVSRPPCELPGTLDWKMPSIYGW